MGWVKPKKNHLTLMSLKNALYTPCLGEVLGENEYA